MAVHVHQHLSSQDTAANAVRSAADALMDQRLESMQAQLTQLVAGMNTRPGPIVGTDRESIDFEIEPFLNAQLDEIRDRGDKLPPDQAVRNAQSFLDTLPASAAPVIQFRARAILGHFHLRLGQKDEGRRLLEEGYQWAPTDRRAVANRVLALWLADSPAEAYRFGCAAAEADPGNEWAASYTVQAASDVPEVEDPLSALPEPLRQKPVILTGFLVFLRRRDRVPEWWRCAKEAALLFPDHPELAQAAALAEVDEISRDPAPLLSGMISDEQRERLAPAVACLDAAWQEHRTHLTDPYSMAAQNLIAAMAGANLLGDRERVIELARAVADERLTDGHIITVAAQMVVNRSEHKLLARLISLGSNDSRVQHYAGVAALQRGDLAGAVKAFEGATIPESEQVLIDTFRRLHAMDSSGRTPTSKEFAAVLQQGQSDARAAVIISREARRHGYGEIAKSAYQSALRTASREPSFAARSMTAMLAAEDESWSDVIELLDNHIPPGADVDIWQTLAAAHAGEWPKRHRNRRFVNDLPPSITDPLVLERKALILSHIGEPGEALSIATDLLGADANNALLRLLRVNCLRRLDRSEDAAKDLGALDLHALTGASVHRVTLIHSVAREIDMPRALEAAYALLRERPNNSDVAAGYVGLFTLAMTNDSRYSLSAEPTAVATGTWVELTPSVGPTRGFLIDEGEDFLGISVFSPRHERAKLVIGCEVGDTVLVPRAIVGPEECKISAIKSRTLHAFHILSTEFQERFPGHGGFVSLQMQENDITPIIEMANRRNEIVQQALNNYARGPAPLAVVARAIGETVLEFAGRLRGEKHRLRTCAGNLDEMAAAHACAIRYRNRGLVLDQYTACIAATAGLLPALKAYFGVVYTPASTLSLFDRRELASHSLSDVLSTKNERTIQDYCNIEVPLYPDESDDPSHKPAGHFGARFMDAALLARTHDALLLSDDGDYRLFVQLTIGVEGIWLQAAMDVAHGANTLDAGTYISGLAELARRNHQHIMLSAALMETAFARHEDFGLNDFSALAEHVGTPDADRALHFQFALDLLRRLWILGSTHDEFRLKKATGLVLSNLLRCYPRKQWSQVLSNLYVLAKGRSRLRLYVIEWVAGHFLWGAFSSSPDADGDTKPTSRTKRSKKKLSRTERSTRKHQRQLVPT